MSETKIKKIIFRSTPEIPREASIPTISCSALQMAALWIEKTSTAVTWLAKDLMWMPSEISFSIGSKRTYYKSYFHITFSAWRCSPLGDQMEMSSSEFFSRHVLRVVSNTACSDTKRSISRKAVTKFLNVSIDICCFLFLSFDFSVPKMAFYCPLYLPRKIVLSDTRLVFTFAQFNCQKLHGSCFKVRNECAHFN